jgi:diaminopimelate epimerase
MRLKFTKMHGLGNDFVVFDAVRQRVELTSAQVRAIADRHLGVGCDQLLLVEKADRGDADFRYRIFNADGGEVEQCGNGARCFARFVLDRGLTDKRALRVETQAGLIGLTVESDGEVTVDMGLPRFKPSEIPFIADREQSVYALDVDGATVEIGAVSMGNPHAVLVVDNVERAPVASLGPSIERHPRFPNRVNVGFMQRVGPDHIRLRVFERGAGETRACGTGACAAVAVGVKRGMLGERVRVDLPGGTLTVGWDGKSAPMLMKGPAVSVFEGEIEL